MFTNHNQQENEPFSETDIQQAKEFCAYLYHDTQQISNAMSGNSQTELTVLSKLGDIQSILTENTFDTLQIKNEIKKPLYNLGFDKLSDTQVKNIPDIIDGKSLMFQSKSGTGKTISFVVGTLSNVVPNQKLQIVVISPTLELNEQIRSVFEKVGAELGIKCRIAKRGERIRLLNFEVLIGSPAGVMNILRSAKIPAIPILVIDEADTVLDPDAFGAQTAAILQNVQFNQYLLFSATYNDSIRRFVKKIVPGIEDRSLETNTVPDRIRLYHLEIHDHANKKEILSTLFAILSIGQLIIFVRTRRTATHLQEYFEKDLNRVSVLHGELPLDERAARIADFRHARTKILITTDLLSRGIDIPAVNLVINYDLPIYNHAVQTDTYIHRIGRCGRFHRKGFVIDFVCGDDDAFAISEISRSINRQSIRLKYSAIVKAAEELN